MSRHNEDWLKDALSKNKPFILREYHRRRGSMGDDCVVILAAPNHPLGKIIAETYPRPQGDGDWLPSEEARRRGAWVYSAVPRALARLTLGPHAGEHAGELLARPLPLGHFVVVVVGRAPGAGDQPGYLWAHLPAALARESTMLDTLEHMLDKVEGDLREREEARRRLQDEMDRLEG
jgi:hypothetical protein